MDKGYYISRDNKTKDIIYIDYDRYKGYNITPKNQVKYAGIKVNKMIIVKPSMIEKVLKRKIKARLDLYLKTIIEIMDESSSDDSSSIRGAINDLTRFRNIVEYKYQKYLDEKYVSLLKKKIEVLEYELKKKLISFNDTRNYNEYDLYNIYRRNYENYIRSRYFNNYAEEDELTSHRTR